MSMDNEQFENIVEEVTESVVDQLDCAEDKGIDPGVMFFRLMYPLVEVPTGKTCRKPECHCDGENDEIAVICSAVN